MSFVIFLVFWKKNRHFQSVSIFFHPCLVVLESTLWGFSSLANHYLDFPQRFKRNLGHRRNDSKYRDVAPLLEKKFFFSHQSYSTILSHLSQAYVDSWRFFCSSFLNIGPRRIRAKVAFTLFLYLPFSKYFPQAAFNEKKTIEATTQKSRTTVGLTQFMSTDVDSWRFFCSSFLNIGPRRIRAKVAFTLFLYLPFSKYFPQAAFNEKKTIEATTQKSRTTVGLTQFMSTEAQICIILRTAWIAGSGIYTIVHIPQELQAVLKNMFFSTFFYTNLTLKHSDKIEKRETISVKI